MNLDIVTDYAKKISWQVYVVVAILIMAFVYFRKQMKCKKKKVAKKSNEPDKDSEIKKLIDSIEEKQDSDDEDKD